MQTRAAQPDPTFLDQLFSVPTAVDLIAVFVGVLLAQWLADKTARKKQSEEDEQNREFVRSAVASSLCHALIGVWRHQGFVSGDGMPNSIGIPPSASRVDPFRLTQALGREAYERFVAITDTVELTNAYLSRLAEQHALALAALAIREDDLQHVTAADFAKAFYLPHIAQIDAMLRQIEAQISEYLAAVDPVRLKHMVEVNKPKLQQHLPS